MFLKSEFQIFYIPFRSFLADALPALFFVSFFEGCLRNYQRIQFEKDLRIIFFLLFLFT